jgi:hypothetical protein
VGEGRSVEKAAKLKQLTSIYSVVYRTCTGIRRYGQVHVQQKSSALRLLGGTPLTC